MDAPAGQDSYSLKVGLAKMLAGGVIMDVTDATQARIAEDAGAGMVFRETRGVCADAGDSGEVRGRVAGRADDLLDEGILKLRDAAADEAVVERVVPGAVLLGLDAVQAVLLDRQRRQPAQAVVHRQFDW